VVGSSVSGNPARCGWLVSATAITVADRSLKVLVAQDQHFDQSGRAHERRLIGATP
jgi:hypothetical protein